MVTLILFVKNLKKHNNNQFIKMKHLLRKCLICRIYTLKSRCSHCSSLTVDPTPAKFSPDDKYILYRLPESYNKKESNQNLHKLQSLFFMIFYYGYIQFINYIILYLISLFYFLILGNTFYFIIYKNYVFEFNNFNNLFVEHF